MTRVDICKNSSLHTTELEGSGLCPPPLQPLIEDSELGLP